MTLLDEALAWHAAGYTPVPIRPDGEKRPIGLWKHLQNQQPTADAVRASFAVDTDGIGLICGTKINLEMFEAEGRSVTEGYIPRLAQAFADHDLTELWEKVSGGYAELTPSGGLHWYYTTDGARSNTKLARRPATDEELAADPQDTIKVLFETRGQGGFSVIAPSNGRTHRSGKPWMVIKGDRCTIPHLTADERDALYAMANTLDQMPAVDSPQASQESNSENGLRPGDDFNARATWQEILGPHGWTIHRHFGGTLYGWQRPGKHHPGTSATTGKNEHDRLYVFSTSTEFQEEKPYSKFAAYALLEHGNDFKAAAKALGARGYGDPLPDRTLLSLVHSEPNQPATSGANALKVQQKTSELPQKIDATLTDNGNAELMIAQHGDHLRYVPSRGQWLAWDGNRWAWCEDDSQAIQAATQTIHAIQATTEAVQKHKTRSLSKGSLESAISLARRDERIRVASDQLNFDPWQLNTPSGIVDLRNGKVRPAAVEDLCTNLTGAAYNPFAIAPRWEKFLHDTFGDNPEMISFVQRLAGYSACGIVLHHILPFLHGSGGNGKSVFLDILVSVLGDYASTAPAGFLMAGKEDDNAIARLAGLRLVVCSEVNQSARFDEAKVKLLTGGDRLTARFLYQRHFTFIPTHKLWLMGNHQPRVDAGGEAFWRRLRLIPFTRQIAPEKRIEGLAQQIVADEADGILAWIVAGSVDAYANGLREPAEVLAATKTYADEEDTLARFVSDRIKLGGGRLVRENTAKVRAAYADWCRNEGEKELSPQVFGRELRSRWGIETIRSHGSRFYVDMTLYADPNSDPQDMDWASR